tara:strand:- start:20140 stop:20898 length:759 start_codon:yes stop_codon:yes gene_type:complete
MIASLPMYDRPSNCAAHDALWDLIRDGLRAGGIDAPETLDREIDHLVGWARADLVLGQICNLPYRAEFRGKVTVIGAADYGLPDCPAGHYNSVFVARKDGSEQVTQDFATLRFAVNALMSHSGYGAPMAWAAANGFRFAAPIITGAHDRSVQMVADGRADIAAIDAQTWRVLAQDFAPTCALRVLGTTQSAPGMTFITRSDQDPAPYFDAIQAAITALQPKHAQILGLSGIITLPQADYDLPLPPLPQTIGA